MASTPTSGAAVYPFRRTQTPVKSPRDKAMSAERGDYGSKHSGLTARTISRRKKHVN